MKEYVPDAADIVWMNFSPQTGREQAGHRPALVLSPASYNAKSGLAVVCPISTQRKGYPFEVPLPANGKVQGVVLSDQVRNLDWRTRSATHAGKASATVIQQVRENVAELLEMF